MEQMQVFELAEKLARAIDKRIGPKQDTAFKQFMRRQISLTGAGDAGPEDVRGALRAMAPNLPKKTDEWLARNLFRLDTLDDLVDIFWKISVAAVPVKNRHVSHYAHLAVYQSLVRVLYDEFLWNLIRSNSAPLAMTQGAVYGRVVQTFYTQIIAHFTYSKWKPTASSVDANINRAFEEFFRTEDQAGDAEPKPDEIEPLETTSDTAPSVPRPISAPTRTPVLPSKPRLIVDTTKAKTLPKPTATSIPTKTSVPKAQPAPMETVQDIQRDIERLRRQIAMLNGTLQLKFKRLQQTVYVGDEESAARDPKWASILMSPWHMTELSWFLSQVPSHKTVMVQQEVALAVSWEKRVPSVTRFRKILANVLKRQTGK